MKSTTMNSIEVMAQLVFDYRSEEIGRSRIVHADCFEWLSRIPENSIHAIVTDPPYGVKEYEFEQIEKRSNGNGGIWRIPPSFDGSTRAPLPKFTALDRKERDSLRRFFVEWARAVIHALRPGGHVFIASNAFLSQLVFSALVVSPNRFLRQKCSDTPRGCQAPPHNANWTDYWSMEA
jgi:site-specific DNA-methyltransferase (adenine-specific)